MVAETRCALHELLKPGNRAIVLEKYPVEQLTYSMIPSGSRGSVFFTSAPRQRETAAVLLDTTDDPDTPMFVLRQNLLHRPDVRHHIDVLFQMSALQPFIQRAYLCDELSYCGFPLFWIVPIALQGGLRTDLKTRPAEKL